MRIVLAFVLSLLLACAASAQGRAPLTADTPFYVSQSGSDANDCLSSATACLTIQGALLKIQRDYDLRCYKATVNIAAGTYTDPVSINGAFLGGCGVGKIVIQGAGQALTLVQVSGTAFTLTNGAYLTVQGMKIVATGGFALTTTDGGTSIFFGDIDFGNAFAHVGAGPYSRIRGTSNYTISGAFTQHINASAGQAQIYNGVTVNITSASACAYFILATELGLVDVAGVTFTGTGTQTTCGQTGAILGGLIYSAGTTLPGNPAKNYP